MCENLMISKRLGYLDTFIHLEDIILESYVLDFTPDIWRFLNCENSGTWELVSFNYHDSNSVAVIDDIMKFKCEIMGLEDIDENQLLESEDSEEENQDTNASQNLKDGEVNIGNLTALSTPIKENNINQEQILNPIPEPDHNINPNLPYLLKKKCRSLRRISYSMSNKIIVRQSPSSSDHKIVLSVYLLIASVKPFLSLIHSKKCQNDLRQFLSEQDGTTHSGNSIDSPRNIESADDESKFEEIMKTINEFCRLLTMEIKCHITPIFGCFEFLECSFTLDSNLDLKFRTVDSGCEIFNPFHSCKCEDKVNLLKDVVNTEIKSNTHCKKCTNKYLSSIFKEGINIVLKIHQIGLIRADKPTFKQLLDIIKKESKICRNSCFQPLKIDQYSYDFLYSDFDK